MREKNDTGKAEVQLSLSGANYEVSNQEYEISLYLMII